jgi:hypothetical protein
MLSGFSPSLLKLLLNGEPLVIEMLETDGTVTQREVTPEETLRKALDDERYDRIHVILLKSKEGLFLNYYDFTQNESKKHIVLQEDIV